MKAIVTGNFLDKPLVLKATPRGHTDYAYWNNFSGSDNSAIFTKLGVNRHAHCRQFYKLNGGIWPEQAEEEGKTEAEYAKALIDVLLALIPLDKSGTMQVRFEDLPAFAADGQRRSLLEKFFEI